MNTSTDAGVPHPTGPAGLAGAVIRIEELVKTLGPTGRWTA